MTDEEMAEESLISYKKLPKWNGKIFMKDEETCFNDGFLAGLNAGRLKWHKVIDGDLPKDDILADDVSITVLNQNGNKVFYNFLEKVWKLESNNKISKTIAWCKIPSFMEESNS